MPRLVSTAEVQARERLAYWTDLVCDTYVQLECEPLGEGRSIEGEIRSEQLSTLAFTQVTATAQNVKRTPSRIARAVEDYFLVSIQSQGSGRVVQDGRVAHLNPGDFALYDSTRPYELQFDGPFQQYVLMLPGPTLRSALRHTEQLTANTVIGSQGAGMLMIGMIRSLASQIETLAPASSAAVAESVTQILIAGLSSLPAGTRQPASQLIEYHRACIRSLIDAHWRDPAFNVTAIAARLRLSPSTLHRAWSGEACSLAEAIWVRRLDGARADLCNPALVHRSISDIAYACGFNDSAHFSRAFRARFGCAPRELRPTAGTAPADRPAHPL